MTASHLPVVTDFAQTLNRMIISAKRTSRIPTDAETTLNVCIQKSKLGRVAQSVGHLTRKSGVLGSIPGLATYFRFSFRFFKKGSCQLLVIVCARSTG